MRDIENYNTYQREYQQMRYEVRRALSLTQLGNACTNCSSTKQLEFDHTEPATKVMSIGKMWTASEERFQTELAKCQLLCKSCHIEKTRQETRFRNSEARVADS